MRGRVLGVLVAAAAMLAAIGAPAHAGCAVTGSPEKCESGESPVISLRGVATAHHGSSYAHPGYTTLNVLSTPEAAYVTVSDPRTHARLQWLTGERESNVVRFAWSCRRPRQAFREILTARANVGATVTAEVSFHAQLSTHWCQASKQREEARRAAAKRQREAVKREAAERQEHEAAEQHEREHREQSEREHQSSSECTNGTYVNSAGNTVCKPVESEMAPAGATAECEDGTYSFSESRSGTCSHHGGVRRWLSG